MSQKSRKELLNILRLKYANADRSARHALIETLINATGYNRKYALRLLNEVPTTDAPARKRVRKYDEKVVQALNTLWEASNYLCGKRLIPFIRCALPALEDAGRMHLDPVCRAKLLEMSPATADRILRKERGSTGRSRSLTKAGSLLRKHVPIRTFADWNDARPGFLEIDTVGHDGGIVSGAFLHTLTMTDVATGWTELFPLAQKTDECALDAIVGSLKTFPFPIYGIDSDNGTEFMNHKLIDWCAANELTFTRSRPYRKNDQCYVEEKNGSVVRKLVGHERHSGARSLSVLQELYRLARLYVNYFQPSAKLVSKERIGAKVQRKYDPPKTPAERLALSDPALETFLQSEREKVDPMTLISRIRKLQKKLCQPSSLPEPATILELPGPQIFTANSMAHQIEEHFRKTSVGEIVSVKDLYAYTAGRPSSNVRTVVSRLIERGLVVKFGFGKYCKCDASLDLEGIRQSYEIERLKQVVQNQIDGRPIFKRITEHFYALEHGEVVTASDLMKYANGKRSTVTMALKRLVDKGEIARCGTGKYCRFDEDLTEQELTSLRSVTLLPDKVSVTG